MNQPVAAIALQTNFLKKEIKVLSHQKIVHWIHVTFTLKLQDYTTQPSNRNILTHKICFPPIIIFFCSRKRSIFNFICFRMSVVADPQAAKTIQTILKDLSKNLKKVESARKASETGLETINNHHADIENEGVVVVAAQHKLQKQYQQGISDCEKEEEELRKALDKIYQIRNLRNEMRLAARQNGNKENIRRAAHMKMLAISAQTIPLWVGEDNEDPPPLCGSVPADPNYVAEVGDMVAALVRGPDDENWILAEVVSYNATNQKYDVDDIDEEQKDRHTLSKRKIIPLPVWRASYQLNPDALYEKGTTVNAIYPQTTCFYKGVIKEPPQNPSDDYEVLFEDPSYVDGYSPPLGVAQRYIIPIVEKKKGK